ncbi:hypothetical protein LDY98_20365, partial [Pseudomonas aeruginosa]|nr:hypothetical protein [Pseudomonas aeruginosa]
RADVPLVDITAQAHTGCELVFALVLQHRLATALDDPWAPPRSRDAFVEAYRNAPLETLDLRPDGGPLGHMGYFRAGAEALWDDALRWLRRHPENA